MAVVVKAVTVAMVVALSVPRPAAAYSVLAHEANIDALWDSTIAPMHAVGTTIPEMTKVAWEKKHDEIQKVIPSARRETVVFNFSRKQYDEKYGTDYERPHGFARFLGWIYKLIPKIGPFRVFSFSVPTPEAERLFLDSFTSTREHFKQSLDALRAGHLHLVNADFDTGLPTEVGDYTLADETYDKLLEKLADRKFANVSEGLRANLLAYYGKADSPPVGTNAPRARSAERRRSSHCSRP